MFGENLNLGILTHSLPLIRPLGPARLVLRSRRIQLWLKDQSAEDSANLAGIFQHARLP
jgi:hypothetical protein